MNVWVLLGIAWVACGIIGAAIGEEREMGATSGFAWGAVLGVIGVAVVAASKRTPAPTVLDSIAVRPVAAGWWPDPLGRFEVRYHDGHRWTANVGRTMPDGTQTTMTDHP